MTLVFPHRVIVCIVVIEDIIRGQIMPTPSQQAVDKESLFMTENYGGLNLESSPMNMPFTDSPSVTNLEIEPSGKIKKRRGSKVVADFLEYTAAHIPFKFSNGLLAHIVTDGDVIRVLADSYGITSSSSTNVLYSTGTCLTQIPARTNKSNYLPKISHVSVRDGDTTKITFFTNKTVPITLSISEYTAKFTYVTGTTHSVSITSSIVNPFTLFDQAVPAAFYFVADADKLWRVGTSFSSNLLHLADETGVIVASSPLTSYGTCIVFSWSWESDTQWRSKEHTEDSLLRFNVAPMVDTVVEISPQMKISLANDWEKAKTHLYDQYNYTGWISSTHHYAANSFPARLADGVTLQTTSQEYFDVSDTPADNLTYAATYYYPTWGDAAQSSSVNKLGISHITWGGIATVAGVPAPPVPFIISRFLGIYVGGTGSCDPSYLHLRSKGLTYTLNTAAGYQGEVTTGNYYMGLVYNAAGQVKWTTSATDPLLFYCFQAGAPLGVKGLDSLLSYIPAAASLPSGCQTTAAKYAPLYIGGWSSNLVGLYPWCNYNSNDFLNVSTTFQGRTVLAGFTLSPESIVMSNTGTQTEIEGGSKCSNFETVWADSTIATSPLEIKLSSTSDEQITSMIQWYDSLFVGTTKRLYRVHGGQNISVTPSNYYVDNVANVPCVFNSMVLTAEGVVFLSDSGVYRVYIDSSSGQYKIENIGLKIRKAIRKGLDKGRLFLGLGKLAYDSINNVLYVLVGDNTSLTPRRCFVYFADKQSWVEWTLASGYFPATTVSCYDGRVFFTLSETTVSDASWNGTEKLAATLTEFNIDNSFLDLVKTNNMDDSALNVHIKLPVPRVTFSKAASPVGTKANFVLETPTVGAGIRVMPIGYLGYSKVTNNTTATVGVEGTDFVYTKDNNISTSSAFQAASAVIQVEVLGETDLSPLYIKNVTTEEYIPLTSLTYNVAATSLGYHAKCANGDAYDGDSCTYGLAYPSWWLSPAFTRNNIQSLKRMNHFYAVFENSSTIQTNSVLAPSWAATPKMNLAIVQNGSRIGQSSTAITDASNAFDTTSTADSGLDYYRVVYPIDGNFTSFQSFVYSFDDGNWELVGYQLDTDISGKTSRKPYD